MGHGSKKICYYQMKKKLTYYKLSLKNYSHIIYDQFNPIASYPDLPETLHRYGIFCEAELFILMYSSNVL